MIAHHLNTEARTARQIALAAVEAERERVENLLLAALDTALRAIGAGPSKAARLMRVTPRTVSRWRSKSLAPHFVRHLAVAHGLLPADGGAP